MTSQVFYRKWRPQKLAEVVGQEPITRTLLNALSSNRISHAYLFCGPRGTGKTSTARILAKAVNCLTNGNDEPCNTCDMCLAITEARHMDVIEIDAASNTGVDDIRSLREKVNYAPTQARYKVYIIDEVHMLSTSASNALLKTLEEPPSHVIFILATTEAHKILPTILSRCQRFDFRRLSQADVTSKLTRICETEGINIEPQALNLIARSATGSLRDAENLIQQLTTYYGSDISLQQVQVTLGITGDWRSRELARHILNNDIGNGITTINSINNDGLDLRQFNRELIEYLRALLLIKTGSAEKLEFTVDELSELKELAEKASLEDILRATKTFGQLEMGHESYSTLPLELALVDCALPAEEVKESPAPPAEPKPSASRKAPTRKPPEAKSAPPTAEPASIATSEPPTLEPEPPVLEPVSEEEPEPPATEFVPEEPVPSELNNLPADIPAPVSPVAAVPSSPLEATNEIERLIMNWKQVIEKAPAATKRTAAIAILRSAGVKPVAMENDIVSLSFRYPYHKDQIEKIENQRVAQEIIGNFLGRPCQVRCIMEDNHLLKAALDMGAQIIDVEE